MLCASLTCLSRFADGSLDTILPWRPTDPAMNSLRVAAGAMSHMMPALVHPTSRALSWQGERIAGVHRCGRASQSMHTVVTLLPASRGIVPGMQSER